MAEKYRGPVIARAGRLLTRRACSLLHHPFASSVPSRAWFASFTSNVFSCASATVNGAGGPSVEDAGRALGGDHDEARRAAGGSSANWMKVFAIGRVGVGGSEAGIAATRLLGAVNRDGMKRGFAKQSRESSSRWSPDGCARMEGQDEVRPPGERRERRPSEPRRARHGAETEWGPCQHPSSAAHRRKSRYRTVAPWRRPTYHTLTHYRKRPTYHKKHKYRMKPHYHNKKLP